ncbi:unnamed protein product, partial [Ectocarpus fasciculatus]
VWHVREVFAGGRYNLRRILSGLAVRSLASEVITISDVEKHHIGGLNKSNVTTVYNFVDVKKFQPTKSKIEICQELGLDPHMPIIVSLGGAGPRKGLVEILDSVDLVRAQYLIAGPKVDFIEKPVAKEDRYELKREDLLFNIGLRPFKFKDYASRVRLSYQKLNNCGRVRFLGNVHDVQNYIAASDLLVFA